MSQGCYAGQEGVQDPRRDLYRAENDCWAAKGCAAAKTVHGRETRAIRATRDAKLRELREMKQTLKNAGLII
tara:strand:+ start:594 stop:809 length:216 start_codon:yes stop_codon:yes gene_type:complete